MTGTTPAANLSFSYLLPLTFTPYVHVSPLLLSPLLPLPPHQHLLLFFCRLNTSVRTIRERFISIPFSEPLSSLPEKHITIV